MDWTRLADDKTIEKTAEALRRRGIDVTIVENGREARKKVLEFVPKKSEVLHATSVTLGKIGITKDIEESGEYDSLKKKVNMIDDKEKRDDIRRRMLSPDYVIGSVHAITEGGQVLIASATGSQIAPYVYGANNVIWVVGTQKIVKSLDDGFKRIYEYSLERESERVREAYNMSRSSVNKILVYEREKPGRIRLIFVKEELGF